MLKIKTKILFSAALAFTLCPPLLWRGAGGEAFAQPGALDPTFGSGGKVTTPVGSGNDRGQSVAMQNDGKILVAGQGSNGEFALVRYNSNGSLDNTFGSGGIVTTSMGGSGVALSVAIQADGKIVLAGSGYNDFALVRYNTDGTLDTTFGSGGIVTTDFANSYEGGYSAAIQTDGKILVAGTISIGSNADFALARYNSNGTLDNSFDTDGKVTTAIGSADDQCYSAAIQTDGKILLAGITGNAGNWDIALVRYDTDGTLDNTFGIGGIVTTDLGSSDYGWSVAIQSDGKILVAGFSYIGLTDFSLVRYNTDGSLDNTFGSGGMVTTDFGSSYDMGWSVATQSDGKILVAGYSDYGPFSVNFALVRYNGTGSLDNSFGSGGKVTTPFGSNAHGYSVAIQSDGKIVVAGYSYNGANVDFAVARYNGDPLGIEENTEEINLSVYPNPTTGKFHLVIVSPALSGINSAKQSQIEIYNVLSEKIITKSLTDKTSVLDLSVYSDGIYFYKAIEHNNKIITGKIIKQ